jgi:hypothetical protein
MGQNQGKDSRGAMRGNMAQAMPAQSGYPVDDLTYDLISVLHTKLEGLAAYKKYLQDAQGDQEAMQILQQCQQQDMQMAQQLKQHLAKHLSSQGGRAGH